MEAIEMAPLLHMVLLGLAMAVVAIQDARAQTATPPSVAGNIHAVIYVEVMPTSRANSVAILNRYREATRRDNGNLRCEVVSRIGQGHQFAILEIWRDQPAFETHQNSASAKTLREQIQPIRIAPIDERVHIGISLGPLEPGPGGDAIYVVTHVDVVPPRKDDGLAAVKQLAELSRTAPDNARFEVVQQTNRPNHFTVVEIWRSARAVEAHSMAEPTRRFRDALGPMSGALYDERLFKLVE